MEVVRTIRSGWPMTAKPVLFILPSVNMGGSERVMVEIAAFGAMSGGVESHLLALTKGPRFFRVPAHVFFHEPSFDYRQYSRPIFTLRTFLFLRKKIKEIQPYSLLSFGGRYNSFVLLASFGLGIRTFISDRSRPTIGYGKLVDRVNSVMYRRANGIIAQTERAKHIMYRKTRHQNIRVIGNPVRAISSKRAEKKNIILNVGRFIRSKHQGLLVWYFSRLARRDWRLVFAGDGPYLEATKKVARSLGVEHRTEFRGRVPNIDDLYMQSKVFAFTSTSEGFPNALAEAMAAGLACISFDCEAGPSELIDDGIDGYLVKEMQHEEYVRKLETLVENNDVRKKFGTNAKKKMQEFRVDRIARRYLSLLLAD